MKKVFVILMSFRDDDSHYSNFSPHVFATKKLAQQYCDCLIKHSLHKNAEYHVVRVDMFYDEPYVNALCRFML